MGWFDFRFFLFGLLSMPYALFGLIYSHPSAPKSRVAWCFFLFFAIVVETLFFALNLMDKNGLPLGDVILLTLVSIITFAQLHLLWKARKLFWTSSPHHAPIAIDH